MLLEFKTTNFKSFLEEMDFRMIPAPKQKDLEYSILKTNIANKEYKALSSSVIYGPNAAGKSNIIGAMEVMKCIILRGDIRNATNATSPNISTNKLELIPNISCKESIPTSFYIKFIENNLLIEYEIDIDLGLFMQEDYQRKILKEKLKINEKDIFERSEDIVFNNLKIIDQYMINGFKENEKSLQLLANNNLNSEELFLTNGFKMLFSSKLTNIILDWFKNKFLVIFRANEVEVHQTLSSSDNQKIYFEKTTNEAAKIFGTNSSALAYITPKDKDESQLYSIFNEDDKSMGLLAKYFESYGTIRFINMFPIIIKALVTGSVLILDEFDAHIHPMAIMSIVNIFHDDEINKNHAQLIFNTHNPI
ncbi:MAG: ATP-binding protein [Erysipelotrichaceae bacterium]|nr:ATP-binding protein [Erysipelotrichaceae bacterium]